MKLLPYFAIFTFVAGLSLLVVGFAFSNGNTAPATPGPAPDFFVYQADTPTPAPTDAPTPTPTPPPFDGKVARMTAPDLGIDNAIEEIGLTSDNHLDTPKDAVNKVGWYYIYAKPGFVKNAIFSAHVNYNFKDGPFARLDQAQAGDIITIQMEGGPVYQYEVFYFHRYDVTTMPTGDLIAGRIGDLQRPENEEWITLITCGGRFLKLQPNGLGEYLDRDVVVAKRVQ
jgi:sortase (surface protein transpeptidase)